MKRKTPVLADPVGGTAMPNLRVEGILSAAGAAEGEQANVALAKTKSRAITKRL
jgi:hypothetical protein